jgi:hypothetical protein
MVYSSILTVAFATLAIFTPSIHGRAIEAVQKRQDGFHWVNTWTSMPQLVESSNMPPSPFVCIIYGVCQTRLTI